MRIAANPEFWKELDKLIAESSIIIDRPKASVHPAWPEIIYPLDYGYLDGTSSGDGEGIDIWLGSERDRGLTAVFVTVDSVKRDSEIKLIAGCTEDEIRMIDEFYNGYDSMKGLLILREDEK